MALASGPLALALALALKVHASALTAALTSPSNLDKLIIKLTIVMIIN